jgi:hypothetical protein
VQSNTNLKEIEGGNKRNQRCKVRLKKLHISKKLKRGDKRNLLNRREEEEERLLTK